MSKFHSVVSRRDFMKGLGLAGAGLGAAAATALWYPQAAQRAGLRNAITFVCEIRIKSSNQA